MSLYSFLRPFCLFIQKILWPTKFIGRENVDNTDGGIVISNHYATPDSIIISTNFFKKELNVLVKEEAFKRSFNNKFLRSIGCIPVKRGEPDINAYKSVVKVLNADRRMLIFPEGTRNKEGTKVLAPFKNGAASFALRSGKPVVPMLFWRMHKVFHKNYLIIGKPIYLLEEGFTKHDSAEATEFLMKRMYELRSEVDKIAESGKKGKKKEAEKQAN